MDGFDEEGGRQRGEMGQKQADTPNAPERHVCMFNTTLIQNLLLF